MTSRTFPTASSTNASWRFATRCTWRAYRWYAGVTVILASAGLVAFIVLGEDPDTGTVDLTYEWFTGLFWTVMASALALPSMVLAVCDREHVLSTSA